MNSFCSYWHIINGKQVCYGTKEIDSCDCGGLKNKCNFYEEVRKSSENESSSKQFKITKERLAEAEAELYRLRNELSEKEDECATLRAMLRSIKK